MITFDTDSDGERFQIWKQDQENSCTVASTWMARSMVRQMSFAEEEWDVAHRMYGNAVQGLFGIRKAPTSGPMTLDPRAHAKDQSSVGSTFANVGLSLNQLVAALKAEGLNVNPIRLNKGVGLIPSLLGNRMAAIVAVGWDGGGGHAIVAAKLARNGNVVYLDPGDGRINEQPNDGSYAANYNSVGRVYAAIYLSA